jgi:hypothetical protein
LVGGLERTLSSRVQPDLSDPVREAALAEALKYLHELSTIDLLAITPVMAKYSCGFVDPGEPPDISSG